MLTSSSDMNPTTRHTENARHRRGSGWKSSSGAGRGGDPDAELVVATGPSCGHRRDLREAIPPRGPPIPPLGMRRTLWPMAGYTGTKDEYLTRLRRIEGQVRGL